MAVRKVAHAMGYRFRLHSRDLRGKPDLVFPSRNTVLFVHGCFWHRHDGCLYCYTPKSNIEFWLGKFNKNVARDERVRREILDLGWKVAVVWECEVDDLPGLKSKLQAYLNHDCIRPPTDSPK